MSYTALKVRAVCLAIAAHVVIFMGCGAAFHANKAERSDDSVANEIIEKPLPPDASLLAAELDFIGGGAAGWTCKMDANGHESGPFSSAKVLLADEKIIKHFQCGPDQEVHLTSANVEEIQRRQRALQFGERTTTAKFCDSYAQISVPSRVIFRMNDGTFVTYSTDTICPPQTYTAWVGDPEKLLEYIQNL